jgi:hypothetical protein
MKQGVLTNGWLLHVLQLTRLLHIFPFLFCSCRASP